MELIADSIMQRCGTGSGIQCYFDFLIWDQIRDTRWKNILIRDPRSGIIRELINNFLGYYT